MQQMLATRSLEHCKLILEKDQSGIAWLRALALSSGW
jgi:hypothetical protein